MRIVVLAGGLSMERNVSLSSGNQDLPRAGVRAGIQAILVDMFMGFEDYDGKLEDVFDTPDGFCGDYSVAEAEPTSPLCARACKDQSRSMFGPGVLDVCARRTSYFWRCTAPAARMAACRRRSTCSASRTRVRATYRAPLRWIRT